MRLFICPRCQSKLMPYYITTGGLADLTVEAPQIAAGTVEAFARCVPCLQTYLINIDTLVTPLPGPK